MTEVPIYTVLYHKGLNKLRRKGVVESYLMLLTHLFDEVKYPICQILLRKDASMEKN